MNLAVARAAKCLPVRDIEARGAIFAPRDDVVRDKRTSLEAALLASPAVAAQYSKRPFLV